MNTENFEKKNIGEGKETKPENEKFSKANANNMIEKYYRKRFTDLPDLENELTKVENMRRKSKFTKSLAELKSKIEKTNAKLQSENRSEKDVKSSINNTLDYNTLFRATNPITALGVAEREYIVLGIYIEKLKEAMADFRKELIKEIGIDSISFESIMNEFI